MGGFLGFMASTEEGWSEFLGVHGWVGLSWGV